MTWNQQFIAWIMANAAANYEAAIESRKKELFAGVSGQVLEIGPGTGPNLRYFSDQVQWTGLEPNPFMIPYLEEAAKAADLSINISQTTLDHLDRPGNSFDYVISTLVLCSVPDLSKTLQQIHALLKDGGHFLFIEHVAAPKGTLLRQVQDGIRPLWHWIGDGCQTNRQTGVAIEAAGFSAVTYDAFNGPVPLPIVRPHICGIATK